MKQLGAKWDINIKKWFCESMTEKLKEYREVNVTIPYDLKDEHKEKYSTRWNPEVKAEREEC